MNNKLLIISLISLIILLGFIAKNEVYEKCRRIIIKLYWKIKEFLIGFLVYSIFKNRSMGF